ncbi:MAG TPA: hypothetical protein VI386_15245 [Candidatus Sulfotelmatobacter sp.]
MARRIYFICALLALALLATLIGTHSAMTAAKATVLNPRAASVVRTLIFPEVLGSAALWVAMWYFWFSFDRSHYLKKAMWFALLFFLALPGTILYYFFVYRRWVSAQPPSSAAATPESIERHVTER